jgi:hypothetical protein
MASAMVAMLLSPTADDPGAAAMQRPDSNPGQ